MLALWDGFPVSDGHALLVPRRHVADWFDASDEERAELLAAVQVVRAKIEETRRPDGYNIGINVGEAGGQTVFHLHVHVIPRYAGDVPDPRGGVRHVIPDLGNPKLYPGRGVHDFAGDSRHYLAGPAGVRTGKRLVTGGGSAPMLPHLLGTIDGAREVTMAVAFVMPSGLDLLEGHFVDLLERGGRLRLLTGDYLLATDPLALRRLLDLQSRFENRVELRVFECNGAGFHPKAYLAGGEGRGTAFVGSSNISRAALSANVEWNWRIASDDDRPGFDEVRSELDSLFADERTTPLTADWVAEYAKRRDVMRAAVPAAIEPDADDEEISAPTPNEVQRAALSALDATRAAGNRAGLVVLGTGLGKTFLSAFDSLPYRRVLFVAHREEILGQAMRTFRRVRPEATLGLYTGRSRDAIADVVFASVQTLSKARHLESFGAHAFDYIVVDEFHHATAATYRRLLAFFHPAFLLGLTATPERSDGGDLLGLCGENLVYRCDFPEGIRRGLLSPFAYWGVPDDVDYRNIPWRNGRFDDRELEAALAIESRAQNAMEQFRKRGGGRTFGFCCSTRHADFMRDFFLGRGVKAASVHSDSLSSDPRARSLERLAAGELDVVFSVDMFNEGVDVPEVDAVLLLRPTASRVIWLQQFGRGLRAREGKTLQVIDYVGNHRIFLTASRALFGVGDDEKSLVQHLQAARADALSLPPGCSVTYELEAIEILNRLVRRPTGAEAVALFYSDFVEKNGRRPTAAEAERSGFSPTRVRQRDGSWLGFVDRLKGLTTAESGLLGNEMFVAFLRDLETTSMTRSYKMLVLTAMLDAGSLPGEIGIDDLVARVAEMASRQASIREGLSVDPANVGDLKSLLKGQPIPALVGGAGATGGPWFRYRESEEVLETIGDLSLRPEERETAAELIREIVEWRLARHFLRKETDADDETVE